MEHKKVRFQGEEYWLHDDLISPLSHYNESGELLANAFGDVSYAIVRDGKILRYGEIIGKREDLVDA